MSHYIFIFVLILIQYYNPICLNKTKKLQNVIRKRENHPIIIGTRLQTIYDKS